MVECVLKYALTYGRKQGGGGREQKHWYDRVTKLLDVDITHEVTEPYYGINK